MKGGITGLITVFLLIPCVSTFTEGKHDSANSSGSAAGGSLDVWLYDNKIGNMVNDYYRPAHPGVTINLSFTPSQEFPNRLDPVLASGEGVPDVFSLEADVVRKYVESGLLLDLTDIYETNKSKLLAYPAEVGSYNGRVYALSWQAYPGAMFYRRSLAKKYLGTDDPKVVQTFFNSFNKFLETAKLLNEKSNGSCVVVSSTGDLLMPFLGARKDPWIVNNKLVIDPAMEQYMDICKTLHDNRWEGRVGQWTEGWFTGMQGGLRDEKGQLLEVFSYFLPSWCLDSTLKFIALNTSGDWAIIPGPAPYYYGGAWLGAYKGTKNAAVVKELIRYLTVDDDFLERWAKDTGDIVSNLAVVNKIKGNYREAFLGGQNHYAEFAEIAKAVDGKLAQATDKLIERYFYEQVTAFVNGEKTKPRALADFRRQIETTLDL